MATRSQAMKGNKNASKSKSAVGYEGPPTQLPKHEGVPYYASVSDTDQKYKTTTFRGFTKDGPKTLGMDISRNDSMIASKKGYQGRGAIHPPLVKAKKGK